jgi:hypothetical protein
MTHLREVRLLLRHREVLRKVCKIFFTPRDASVYLVPYAAKRRFYYGSRTLPEAVIEETFPFTSGAVASEEPHLSVHETGRIHVYAGKKPIAGPLQIPRLSTLRGEHVATVTADTFDALAVHSGSLRTAGSALDQIILADNAAESGRFALYINGQEPHFQGGKCWLIFTLRRPTLRSPMFVGIKAIPQFSLSPGPGRGIVVIAGWDPTRPPSAALDFLYIRGE